jgi:hypothetical protein
MNSELSLRADRGIISFDKLQWVYVLFFLGLYAAFMCWRIKYHPNHFKTVDGDYFTQIANAIVRGRDMPYHILINEELRAPYQPLYPLYLAMLIFLSGLNGVALQSLSAIVISGCLLAGFVKILGRHWFLSIPCFFFDHYIEVVSHLWSEGLLMILLLWSVHYAVIWKRNHSFVSALMLTLLLSLMLLTRHAATFLCVGIVAWFLVCKISYKRILSVIMMPIILYVCWCLYIYITTGYLTGGPRYANSEDTFLLAKHLTQGVFNVLLPIRDFDQTFIISTIIQLLIVGVLVFKILKLSKLSTHTQLIPYSFLCIAISLVYLLFMVGVRGIYYFAEPLDLRLTSPAACLLWWGALFFVNKLKDTSINVLWFLFGLAALLAASGVKNLQALLLAFYS